MRNLSITDSLQWVIEERYASEPKTEYKDISWAGDSEYLLVDLSNKKVGRVFVRIVAYRGSRDTTKAL